MASEAPRIWRTPSRMLRRSWTRRMVAALVFVLWPVACTFAQEATSPANTSEVSSNPEDSPTDVRASRPLEYVMVYGPADREEEWRPTGAPAHFPMDPAKFHKKVAMANAATSPQPPGAGTAIRSARYEVRFESGGLATGNALLQIEHLGPMEATLILAPCNLALGRAGWADRDGEVARLGLGPSGLLELRVDQRGLLEFDWSLQGRREVLGGDAFEIELPACPASQLHLTLREDRVPVTQSGILSVEPSSEAGMRNWLIELGSENRLSLRIAPQDDPDGHSRLTELREKLDYTLSPGGLELSAELQFDVLGQPLRRFELSLAPQLELISVLDGDAAVDWQELSTASSGRKRVVIEPASPLRGLGRELTLTALAPIRLDEPWRLPGLTVGGVLWCEASASLTVLHPLRLNDVVPNNARVSGVRPNLAQRTAHAIDLQLYSADAEVDVVLGQARTPPKVDYGVDVEMTGGQIAGRQRVDFEAEDGEHFQLVGTLTRSWVIDSIQSDRPGVVGDWRVERKDRTKQQVVIDLAQPLASGSPVQLDIMARSLQSPIDKPHSPKDVIPVEFSSVRPGIALVSVHAPEPYQLQLTGNEGLVQRKAESLSARERQLFMEAPRGLVFLHDGSDENLTILPKRRNSMYSAEIDVSVSVVGKRATENFVFRIDPESARLENVVVELTKHPGSVLRWDPATCDEVRVPADSVTTGEDEAGAVDSRLERWDVRLRPSRSEPFEIRATRTYPVEDTTAVALARLPMATSQTGRLTVGLSGDEPVRIENRDLMPILTEPPRNPVVEMPLSTYEYDPKRHLAMSQPPLVLRLDPSLSGLSKACVWHSQLESRLEPTGGGRHLASYRVESFGASVFHLSLPASIGMDQIDSLAVDGQRTSLETALAGHEGNLAVRLDPTRRFHEITVCYRTVGSQWAVVQRLEVPFPLPKVPVLERHWIVWLPPGHQFIEPGRLSDFEGEPDRWLGKVWGAAQNSKDVGPLDPLASDSWRASKGRTPGRDMGTPAVAGDQGAEPLKTDWGEILARDDVVDAWSDLSHEQGKATLFVDLEAIEERGISPKTGVSLEAGVDLVEQVFQLLDQSGLALLGRGRTVVVTSVQKAATQGERLASDENGVLWRVSSGDWDEEIDRATRGEGLANLIAVSKWVGLPPRSAIPWTPNLQPGYLPRDTIGWSVRHINLDASSVAEVLVADRYLLLSGLWLGFLVVACLTWAAALRHSALSFLSIASFFLAAAYCPPFWAPWFSAGFWGSLAGLAARLVTAQRVRRTGRILATRAVSDSQAVAGPVAGCLLMLVLASEAVAQEPPVDDLPRSPALIFAPVGEDRKPTGGVYYVPEPFYTELQRRASQIDRKAPGWMIQEATYRGRLSWQTTSEQLALLDFNAVFAIEVIGKTQKVTIPFGKTVFEAAWLDDRSIEPTWGEDGLPVFSVEPSERCLLELRLRPIPGSGMDSRGFHLAIPRLATSRLELSIPPDAPKIEVPTATGSSLFLQEPSKLAVDLGPIDQLSVTWRSTGRASSGKATRVDELVWLDVALGRALVNVQFRFEIGQDFEGEFHLAHDRRLIQHGPFEVEGATLDRVETLQEASLIRQKLSLIGDTSPTVLVRGRFLVRDASGVGNLQLPALHSTGCEINRRWGAATIGSTLQYEQGASNGAEAIGVSEFVDAWGAEVDPPTMAFRLDEGETSFALTTRPKDPQNSVQWQMVAAYGSEETVLRYRATVDTSEGYLFQHRLDVPRKLEIDEVSVTANDLPRTLRWSRPQLNQIVLFFDAPLSGRHLVQIQGRIRGKGKRSELLELIGLEGVDNETGTIDVFRRPEVSVQLESVEGMTEIGAPTVVTPDKDLGRIVTRWVVDDLGPVKATARIEPNRPKVAAQQNISLRQVPDGWTVDVDCRLEVSQGIVDRIRIETSELWPGPYVVDRGLSVESVDKERGEIVLRPRAPIRDRLEFRISGPLSQEAREGISVPRIRLEYAATDRLVILPIGPSPAIRWVVHGLSRTEVPAHFGAEVPGVAWDAYRVQRDDFSATIQPVPDAAQVYLADIRFSWSANGECRGVALFDLEAGDKESCVLRLPEPWWLVAVSRHGVPISPRADENGSWEIPLARTNLPQRLEVIYAGRLSPSELAGPNFTASPELEDLPVLRTLWTLTADGAYEVGGAGEPISAQRAAMARLRNVNAMIDHAMSGPGRSPEENAAWYRGWLGMWADARHVAERTIAVTASGAVTVRAEKAELETLDALQQAHAEKQGATELWDRLMASPAARTGPGAIWDDNEFGKMPRHYLSEGGSRGLTLHVEQAGGSRELEASVSPVLTVAFVLFALVITWTTGRLVRWPHLFGTALGLCWWLWFSPSFLGLLLAAVCMVAAVRSGWRRPRSSGSAIVRLSVSGRS